MITNEELKLALDESLSEQALEEALATQPHVRGGNATPEQLTAYARKPVLQRGEAVALLQGLIPPVPAFGDDKIFFLDDYADVVSRFLRDCDAGDIPVPCRPIELRDWAAALGVPLLPYFVASIPARPIAKVVDDAVQAAQTPAAPQSSGRSRDAGFDPVLHEQAVEIAAELFKRRRRQPTKPEVAKVLSERIERGQTPERIVRLIRNTWDPTGRGKRRKPNAPHAARLKGR